MKFRHLFTVVFLWHCIAGMDVIAQSFEEGRQAYINGGYETAYEILRPLADSGDPEAQKMMGVMYDYGHGVDVDKRLALEWYIKSANQGEPAVQYQIGSKYFRGDGVEQNYSEAAKWWEMAANSGQVDAQFNLGLMYFRGLGQEQNDVRAAQLFQAASEQGHAQAQYSLAVLYSFGRGVDKSYPNALEWFNKAAEQGVAQAQYNLGIFYENGYGVDRDPETAAKWYERAASQGLAEAHSRLARMQESPGSMLQTEGSEPVATAGEPSPVAADYSPSEITPTVIQREDWVLQQPADSYTLQIASVTSEDDIVDFIRDNGLEAESAYIEVVIDGVTRYNGLYGNYSSYEEAQQAAQELANSLGGVKPWVRNMGILKQMIR